MSVPIHKWHSVDLPLQYFSVFLLLTYIENVPYSPLYLLHTLNFCYLCLVVSQHYGLFFTDSMKCLMSLWFFCWRISYTQRFETLSSRRAKVLHTLHAQCRLGFFLTCFFMLMLLVWPFNRNPATLDKKICRTHVQEILRWVSVCVVLNMET